MSTPRNTAPARGAAPAQGKPPDHAAAQTAATANPQPAEAPAKRKRGVEKQLARFVTALCAGLDAIVAAATFEAVGAELTKIAPIYTQAKALAEETGGRALQEINARLTAAVAELQALKFTDVASATKGKDLMNEITRLQKKKAAIEGPPPAVTPTADQKAAA